MRHLVRNLRVSFIVIAVAVILLFVYALVTGNQANWELGAFVGAGMAISSILNALYDSRKETNG